MVDRVLRALGAGPGTVRVDYAGLNHLGWLYGVHLLDAADPRATDPLAVGAGRTGTDLPGSDSGSDPLGVGAGRTGTGLSGVWGSGGGTGPLRAGDSRAGTDVSGQGDGNLLAGLLDDRPRLESFEEGRLFGADRLRDLGAIPNEYLHYYYDPAGTLAAVRQAAQTRGEFLLGQQRRCYAEILVRDPLGAWLGAWREREATYMAENRELTGAGEREHDESRPAGYEGVALAVMRALALDEPTTLILNVRNRGAVTVLDDGAVVEVPCTVDARGASPQRISPLPAHGTGLIQAVKTAERWVLQAVDSGSRAAAVRAMAAHPLVGSEHLAARLIDAYRAEFPELAYLRAG
ncbi:hypothetical protein KZ829_38555 [Actinoplanes hulinensis]|uniref:Glycosyl hydrolase family 4 C-terminal domain-containing protein n=1 Tax=Actinoplanes hulinensis TaxID=1144547 RepID=A0ABS7BFH5_9ACTN|nr:hypothetical protein [Actinoplanes hulinensis]